MASQLASSNSLRCSGLLFYGNKLYASAPPGLLEIEGGLVTKIYRWGRDYSALEGAWVDNARGLLWVSYEEGGDRLAYYDGKQWRAAKFPKPAHGYISRGDDLRGFRGVSNSRAFWLEGAGRAWRWKGPESGNWVEEDLPAAFHPEWATGVLLKLLIPTERNIFLIKRGDKDHDWLVGLLDSPRMQDHPKRPQVEAQIQGDSTWYLANGQWIAVTNKDDKFIAEDAVATSEKGYLRTRKGELVEVTETGVAKVQIPGACEAIAPSAEGVLLASFRGLGVFELREGWRKVLESPYAAAEGGFEVRLAAQSGRVALAVTPGPTRPSRSPSSWVYNSQPGLWIAQGQQWKPVTVPPAQ